MCVLFLRNQKVRFLQGCRMGYSRRYWITILIWFSLFNDDECENIRRNHAFGPPAGMKIPEVAPKGLQNSVRNLRFSWAFLWSSSMEFAQISWAPRYPYFFGFLIWLRDSVQRFLRSSRQADTQMGRKLLSQETGSTKMPIYLFLPIRGILRSGSVASKTCKISNSS